MPSPSTSSASSFSSAPSMPGSIRISPSSPRTTMELVQTHSLCRTQTPSATCFSIGSLCQVSAPIAPSGKAPLIPSVESREAWRPQISSSVRNLTVALCCLLAAVLVIAPAARAGVDGQCPAIADKPNDVDHVDYTDVQHLTYCFGPITIKPGQNVIRYRNAIDGNATKLWPQQNGYITRFDPEFIFADGTVPAVDVLHLHHAVWVVDGNPQFAVGEEKTIQQLPTGFGWRSHPGDSWLLNDMLHDLVAKPAQVYVVWRIDFVPDSSPDAASIKPVQTKWLDVAGNP